jgi:hypothetical protein
MKEPLPLFPVYSQLHQSPHLKQHRNESAFPLTLQITDFFQGTGRGFLGGMTIVDPGWRNMLFWLGRPGFLSGFGKLNKRKTFRRVPQSL